ncbi:MAG: hypothetical protein ABFS21_01620 [Actinomycetota bacterium]
MTLLAASAVRDITPPLGTHFAGFAARTAPSTSIHDPLSARAIAVGDGSSISVVVALDLIALTVDQHREFRRHAAATAGIPETSVVLSVSHTHGGPTVMPGALGPEPDDGYLTILRDGAAAAVTEACSRMVPVTVSQTAGECTEVAHNRLVQDGPTDPVVPVIEISDERGRLIAVVFSFACHPVVLGSDNLSTTADWPGAARDVIERTLPGTTAIFLQGCCGQLNTGHSPQASMSATAQQGRTFTEAKRIGTRVAESVLDVVGNHRAPSIRSDVAVAESEVTIDFAEEDQLLAESIEAWQGELVDAAPSQARVLEMWLRWADAVPGHAPNHVEASVAAHRWGDALISFLPGEPFVDFALDLRHETQLDDLLVAGYSGGVPGYVPYPPNMYDVRGYEIDDAHRFYGQPGVIEPTVGPRLVDAALQTIRDATHGVG